MLSNVRVTLFLALIAAVIAAALAGMTIASRTALQKLSIGSPLYTQIVLSKDLIADILPPPQYVVESYLEATLALNNPAQAASHAIRLEKLKKDYDERHEYWLRAKLDSALQSKLTEQADEPAQKFYQLLFDKFVPALRASDTPSATAAYEQMTRFYTEHRAAIDAVVPDATALNQRLEASAAEESSLQFRTLLIACIVSSLVSLGCLLIVRAKLVTPLKEMSRFMHDLANGTKTGLLSTRYQSRGDEIGTMAKALAVFQQSVATSQQMKQMADAVRDQATSTISASTNQTSAMTDDAVAMAECATRVRQASTDACSATDQALNSTNLIAAATEQLTNSFREISSSVSTVAQTTKKAVGAGNAAKEKIANLSSAVSKISEVVSLIGEIANKTNLLALNATIEAARAGDAGKGFAVVANEVKQLSTQTTRSTEEIRRQIEQVMQATTETVSATDSIQKLIDEADGAAAAIAMVMEQQSSATDEIARNATESLSAVKDVNEAMTVVRAEADQTLQKATNVKTLSATVSDAVSLLGGIVVRMVKDSTDDEMERRRQPRYPVILAGEIQGIGSVVIDNISLGGAYLLHAPRMSQGSTGALQIKDQSLSFVVLSADEKRVHIKFVLPPTEKFKALFSELTRGKIPLPEDHGEAAA